MSNTEPHALHIFKEPLTYKAFGAAPAPDMPDGKSRPAPAVEDPEQPKQLREYITHATEDDAAIYLPKFIDFQARLREELELRQPPQRFPEDTESEDDSEQLPAATNPQPPTAERPYPVIDLRAKRALKDAENARKTPMARERRFQKMRKIQMSARRAQLAIAQLGPSGPLPEFGKGLQFEPAAMVDGQYVSVRRLTGRKSRLRMRFVDWNGRSAHPIVDWKTNQIVGVLAGGPRGKSWAQDVDAASKACADIIPQVRFSDAESKCGASPSLTGGLGLAQEGERVFVAPGKSAILEAVVFATLFTHLAVRRIAGFATCAFYIFARQMHDIFETHLNAYEKYYSGSQRPLPRSVFSAATFELGPNPLRPMENDMAWGWAALTALGFFDSTKGGHIILWDFNMVVRFPAGATILLPRALVRYSFVDIQPTESRYCLVQYTPAPVFNFTENFGRSDVNFAKFASRHQHEHRESRRAFEVEMLWPQDYLTHIERIDDACYRFPGVDTPAPQPDAGM